MPSLSERIREDCSDVLEQRFGKLSSASLVRTESGQYAYPYIEQNGDGQHVLADDIQSQLGAAIDVLDGLVTVTGIDGTVREAHTWTPDSDSVYVGFDVTYEREGDDSLVSEIMRLAAVGSSRVEVSNVTSVECHQSVYPHKYTDGTVTFRTETPHEVIANMDSFDEYVEWRAENSEKTPDEIRSMDDYPDHYHPSSSEFVETVCEKLTASFDDNVRVSEPVRKAATGGSVEADGTVSGTIHVFARVEELLSYAESN